jgi:chromosome segregation ATPase
MEKNITKNDSQTNRLLVIILVLSILAGTVAFVVQYLSFKKERASLQQAVIASENDKVELKTKLDNEIKAKLLSQERALKEEEALNLELNKLKSTLEQAEKLQAKTEKEKESMQAALESIKNEMISLKESKRILEGKINNPKEAKLAREARLQSLKELRTRTKNFKIEALLNKKRAEREIDKIKLEKGNRGFVIQGGKATLNAKTEIKLEKIIVEVGSPKDTEENK